MTTNNDTTTPPAQGENAPAGLYPPSTRTGIPKLDRVLEAVAKQDGKTLGELAEMTRLPCTTSPYGMTEKPPCEGKPEATPLELFPAYACEPVNLYRMEQVRTVLTSMVSSRQLYVYAAYRSTGQVGVRSAAYAVTFASSLHDEKAPTLFIDGKGALMLMYNGCGTAGSVMPKDKTGFILPPKNQQ